MARARRGSLEGLARVCRGSPEGLAWASVANRLEPRGVFWLVPLAGAVIEAVGALGGGAALQIGLRLVPLAPPERLERGTNADAAIWHRPKDPG